MKLKNFSIITIITLIAVFSIVGIIACSGDAITGGGGYSYSGGEYGGDGGTSGGDEITTPEQTNAGTTITPDDQTNAGTTITPDDQTNQTPSAPSTDNSWDNDPNNDIFYAPSYMNIYTPWTGGPNYRRVSYFNVNKLTYLWKKQIDHGRYGNGRRWLIRDGDNTQADPRIGNYYFFDKSYNIVYRNNSKNYTIKVMDFLGGMVVNYSSNVWEGGKITNWSSGQKQVMDAPGFMANTWSIGGLYRKTLSYNEYHKYGNQYLEMFMHHRHDGEKTKGLVVIVMNIGYSDGNQNEFGLDSYYSTLSHWNNESYFLGQNPHTYKSELNWRVNMTPNWGYGYIRETSRGKNDEDRFSGRSYRVFYSDNLGHWGWKDNYKFVHAFPYTWHTNKTY